MAALYPRLIQELQLPLLLCKLALRQLSLTLLWAVRISPRDLKKRLTTIAGVSTTEGGKLSSGDKGAIAGGIVGGFVLIGAIGALILALLRKQKDTRDNGNNQVTRDNGNNQVTSDSGYNQDTSYSGYNQDTWDSGNNMDPKDSDNNMPAPERYDGVQGSGLLQYLPRGVRDTLAGDRGRDIEIAGGRLADQKSEGPIG
jgi:hypothetical protein